MKPPAASSPSSTCFATTSSPRPMRKSCSMPLPASLLGLRNARRRRTPARRVLWPVVRPHDGRTPSRVRVAAARQGCSVGQRRCRCVCNGAHQRVSPRLAHRLASRRSPVRHRRWHLPALGMPHEVPSVPFFRPPVRQSSRRSATHEVVLERRSAYLMTQQSRAAYEHHIPPVAALRFSVTFRTLR